MENIIESANHFVIPKCNMYSFIASMCVYVCVCTCIVIVSGGAFIVLCKYCACLCSVFIVFIYVTVKIILHISELWISPTYWPNLLYNSSPVVCSKYMRNHELELFHCCICNIYNCYTATQRCVVSIYPTCYDAKYFNRTYTLLCITWLEPM